MIASVCKQIDAVKLNPDQPDDVVNGLVDSVAIGMVKVLMGTDIAMWPQLLSDFFEMLRSFIFDQRQFVIFNKLTARLL